MSDVFATLIVTAAEQTTAQEAAATCDGGAGMFTTGCSADGNAPATHFISSGMVTDAIVAAVSDACPFADITDEPPFTALERMHLQLVNTSPETVRD